MIKINAQVLKYIFLLNCLVQYWPSQNLNNSLYYILRYLNQNLFYTLRSLILIGFAIKYVELILSTNTESLMHFTILLNLLCRWSTSLVSVRHNQRPINDK